MNLIPDILTFLIDLLYLNGFFGDRLLSFDVIRQAYKAKKPAMLTKMCGVNEKIIHLFSNHQNLKFYGAEIII